MLDEPVNGLDPEGVIWIRTLLKALAGEGRTVFLSSHLMSEMSLTADRLIIVGRGRLIAQTTMAGFLNTGSGSFVRVRSPQAGPSRQCSPPAAPRPRAKTATRSTSPVPPARTSAKSPG